MFLTLQRISRSQSHAAELSVPDVSVLPILHSERFAARAAYIQQKRLPERT